MGCVGDGRRSSRLSSWASCSRQSHVIGTSHAMSGMAVSAGLVLVLACCLATAVSIVLLVATSTTASSVRSRTQQLATVLFALLGGGASAFAFMHAKPTAAAARAALAANHLDDACAEAQALIDLDVDRASGGALLDEVQAQRVASAPNCHQAVSLSDYAWHGVAAREKAARVIGDCIDREAVAAFARGDDIALANLAADATKLAPAEGVGAQWLGGVIRACKALANDDLAAATNHLDAVTTLADKVPATMRPTNFQGLVDAAPPALAEFAVIARGGVPGPERRRSRTDWTRRSASPLSRLFPTRTLRLRSADREAPTPNGAQRTEGGNPERR